MAFDVNSFVIDRPLRGTMFDKSTGEVIFSINQVKDPSLECSGETVYTTDAVGSRIASFDRSKDATLSGSNALIDFGMLAAQLGSDKAAASTSSVIKVPMFEEVAVASSKLALSKVPVGTSGAEVKYIYGVNDDKSIGTKYTAAASASATTFVVTADDKEITPPTGAAAGDLFYIWYEYEADGTDGNGAVEIVDSATAFAKGGRFDLEVILCDICDTNTKYYAHIIFDNAKMDNNVTINFNNEAEHGFTINCAQDYCSVDKKLFRIVIPE